MHPLWGRCWALANCIGDRAAPYPSPMRRRSGRGQQPLLTDGKVGQRRKAAISSSFPGSPSGVLVCKTWGFPTPIWSPEVFVKLRVGPALLNYLGYRRRIKHFQHWGDSGWKNKVPPFEGPWAMGGITWEVRPLTVLLPTPCHTLACLWAFYLEYFFSLVFSRSKFSFPLGCTFKAMALIPIYPDTYPAPSQDLTLNNTQ